MNIGRFSIQYTDKVSGASIRALLAEGLTPEDMERLCLETVNEGHRDVRLVESQYTAKVIKRFDGEVDE